MEPNQATDVVSSSAPAPVSVDDMLASLASGDDASGGGEEAAPETAEAAPTAEAEDEGEDQAEEAPKGEAEAPKPDAKKASRNQRLKAARDAAMADAIAEKKNAAQATSVANYWRAEMQVRDQLLRHVLKETGFQLDQRDLALLDVRREQTRKEFEAQTQQTVAEIDRTHAETQQRRALADDYSAQAHALAKKTGVQPADILTAFALAEQQKFGLSMEQVAQKLSVVARPVTPAPAARQLAANRSAPKPVRGGRVPAPAFDTSLDGMVSFLESSTGKR